MPLVAVHVALIDDLTIRRHLSSNPTALGIALARSTLTHSYNILVFLIYTLKFWFQEIVVARFISSKRHSAISSMGHRKNTTMF